MKGLRELVEFLPALENPKFKAGEWAGGKEVEPGVMSMPYVDYGETATAFIKASYDHGWVLEGFDWPKWARSKEAKRLWKDETTLTKASSAQLAQMLTVLIRNDRFVDGYLLEAFQSGLILRIARRAAAILNAEETNL
jgi:hypothetical protein